MTARRPAQRTGSRLRRRDALGLGFLGLRMRPVRSSLSALGIAIGIAAIVGVTGISGSSRADLLDQLDRLGTNLLTIEAGKAITGDPATLSPDAVGMIRRIPLVEVAAGVAEIGRETVRRSPFIPAFASGGIGVRATDPALLAAVDARLRSGTFLNAATSTYPVVVLGADAAHHLGIDSVAGDRQVWIDDQPFLVAGVLDPVALAPELDRAALVGWSIAASRFGFDGRPTSIYVRADQDQVVTVRDILGRTASPQDPSEVHVSRPSDALEARAAANETFTFLLIALGLVALLVAAVGIVNVMLIAVLERRAEIGLRRALGATRPHIGVQFLGEAVLLAGIGGVSGCLAGAALTMAFAYANQWRLDLPPGLFLVGIGSAVIIGTLAGAYPALRASRFPPMEALRGG